MLIRIFILLNLLSGSLLLRAQSSLGANELFKAARDASFEEKNDEKAKALAKQALTQSPQYSDIEIFLGRLYTWNKQYDSAVMHFERVLTYSPGNEDAGIAYTDLEYWNDHYQKALTICNSSLATNASSAALLLRKAKIYQALKQYKQASAIVDQLVKSEKRSDAALSLAASLKDASAVNNVGVVFDYSYFDKQYNQPWYLTSISYSRQTGFGSVIGRINYANRFGSNGIQGEVDAYPRISKIFYSYISAGYSASDIFPKFRAGFSLYANLPHSFEAEGGIRYLDFGNSTYIYTFSAGKYYSDFLFSVRTYITPGAGGASQSYSLSSRYFFTDADNYLDLRIGTGISPDDRILNVQYSNKTRFTSRQAAVSFNHSFAKFNIFSLKCGWVNQQYSTSNKGNQFDFSLGYQRRF